MDPPVRIQNKHKPTRAGLRRIKTDVFGIVIFGRSVGWFLSMSRHPLIVSQVTSFRSHGGKPHPGYPPGWGLLPGCVVGNATLGLWSLINAIINDSPFRVNYDVGISPLPGLSNFSPQVW